SGSRGIAWPRLPPGIPHPPPGLPLPSSICGTIRKFWKTSSVPLRRAFPFWQPEPKSPRTRVVFGAVGRGSLPRVIQSKDWYGSAPLFGRKGGAFLDPNHPAWFRPLISRINLWTVIAILLVLFAVSSSCSSPLLGTCCAKERPRVSVPTPLPPRRANAEPQPVGLP